MICWSILYIPVILHRIAPKWIHFKNRLWVGQYYIFYIFFLCLFPQSWDIFSVFVKADEFGSHILHTYVLNYVHKYDMNYVWFVKKITSRFLFCYTFCKASDNFLWLFFHPRAKVLYGLLPFHDIQNTLNNEHKFIFVFHKLLVFVCQ